MVLSLIHIFTNLIHEDEFRRRAGNLNEGHLTLGRVSCDRFEHGENRSDADAGSGEEHRIRTFGKIDVYKRQPRDSMIR